MLVPGSAPCTAVHAERVVHKCGDEVNCAVNSQSVSQAESELGLARLDAALDQPDWPMSGRGVQSTRCVEVIAVHESDRRRYRGRDRELTVAGWYRLKRCVIATRHCRQYAPAAGWTMVRVGARCIRPLTRRCHPCVRGLTSSPLATTAAATAAADDDGGDGKSRPGKDAENSRAGKKICRAVHMFPLHHSVLQQ